MKKHRILVSADGMTACPSCNQHMTLDVSALEDVACPFCGAGLTATLREGGKGAGGGAGAGHVANITIFLVL